MKKRKIALVIFFFLVVLILIFLFFKLALKPLPLVSPSKVVWKTYSSQDFGYLISYPSDWEVKAWEIKKEPAEVIDGGLWHKVRFEGKKGGATLLIWKNKKRMPLLAWLSRFKGKELENMPEKENFQVGGLPAVLSSNHIFFQKEDKVYEFVKEKKKDKEVVYDKMISSFSFLEDKVRVEPKAENLVSLAKDDLSQRLKVKKEEIILVQIEAVDWPDTSLGCPKPGMFYAQVITPGFKITLESKGKTFVYHTDKKRVVFCERF